MTPISSRAWSPPSICCGRVQGEQPAGLDLREGLEDVLLHQLLAGQRLTEGDPLVEPVAHQVEGALGLAQPAHRVEDPAGAEALLGDRKPCAALTEQVARPAPARRRSRPRSGRVDPEDGGLPDDPVAGGVGGHDDHAEASVRCGVGLGPAHHRAVRRLDRAGREPLAPVDHPLVALEPRRGGELRSGRSWRRRARSSRSSARCRRRPAARGRSCAARAGVLVQHDRVLEGQVPSATWPNSLRPWTSLTNT